MPCFSYPGSFDFYSYNNNEVTLLHIQPDIHWFANPSESSNSSFHLANTKKKKNHL
jgi:hypothetical protein